jgi:hypothetical protein
MTKHQHKIADDDVDGMVLAAASFFYMYDSSEDDVGDSVSRKNAFVVHTASGFTL